ncbi:MAG: hypothetical protein ACM3JF_01945 [Sphaerimonospora mesophila]
MANTISNNPETLNEDVAARIARMKKFGAARLLQLADVDLVA